VANQFEHPNTSDRVSTSQKSHPDIVELSSEDLFPASDAPPWTLGWRPHVPVSSRPKDSNSKTCRGLSVVTPRYG
jgi:hypothetical protein